MVVRTFRSVTLLVEAAFIAKAAIVRFTIHRPRTIHVEYACAQGVLFGRSRAWFSTLACAASVKRGYQFMVLIKIDNRFEIRWNLNTVRSVVLNYFWLR